jgi:hypothetical protein
VGERPVVPSGLRDSRRRRSNGTVADAPVRYHQPSFFLASGGSRSRRLRLLTEAVPVFADEQSPGLTRGDAAILRFLAALEILETDAWQQYNELGGIQDGEVPGGSGSKAYTAALETLDSDMPQYIHDNTEDEFTHFTFINAYLASKGKETANLDRFRTLSSSKATGAQQIGRLTNLMQLTVDTSWWTRYRSRTKNPDFGDTFPQAVPDLSKGQFPGIPATMATSPRRTTSRRSPTRRVSISRSSSRAAAAFIHRWLSGSLTRKFCASCSASDQPRRCIFRRGRTRLAMRLL